MTIAENAIWPLGTEIIPAGQRPDRGGIPPTHYYSRDALRR